MKLLLTVLFVITAIHVVGADSDKVELTLSQLEDILGRSNVSSLVWKRTPDELHIWDVYRRMHNFRFHANYMAQHVHELRQSRQMMTE